MLPLGLHFGNVCHKFESSNPCVADYVSLASQVNSVLCRMQHVQSLCELCKGSRIQFCSLRGLVIETFPTSYVNKVFPFTLVLRFNNVEKKGFLHF